MPRRTYDEAFDQLGRLIPTSEELYEDREDFELLDGRPDDNIQHKAAVLKASPWVVSIVPPNIPPEMTMYRNGARVVTASDNQVLMGSGTFIECQARGDGKFIVTILTAASIFTRTDGVQPDTMKVEVYLADGESYEGKVLACDFHYNLAALEITSNVRMETATFIDLDDIIIIPIGQAEQLQLGDSGLPQLRRHSTLFKIRPKDMVTVLGRSASGRLQISSGCFSVGYPELDCKELYSLHVKLAGDIGGPVINRHGQAIGIQLADTYFLPSNVVSRWWLYYKQHRKLRRPWLGVKVANFYTANSYFLDSFVRKFPSVSSGVIVMTVIENSQAHSSGLRSEDVIVQCCGGSICSTMEFFEKVWDKAGAPVELSVLRVNAGEQLKLTITVGEDTSIDNFYRWPIPEWFRRPNLHYDDDDDDSYYETSGSSDCE